jgi:hypothetical protein
VRAGQSDSGQYFMRSPGQLSEHIDRVLPIARFSEYISVDNNRCVGGEHRKLLTGAPYSQRLFPRKSSDIGTWRLSRQNCLVDICARNYVRNADLRQQLASPRRDRGKAQHGNT